MKLIFKYGFLLIFFFLCCHVQKQNKKQPISIREDIAKITNDISYISTTKISMDESCSLNIQTSIKHNQQYCNGKRIKQKLAFFNDGSNDITIDIDSLALLSAKDSTMCRYWLEQIGVDSIKGQKFYVLYFFIANGEPEIYLYYGRYGKLLFSQRCYREGSEYYIFDFDRKQALRYLKEKSLISLMDVETEGLQ